MTLSKEDLEAYANAVEMSSQRVYGVLKDVAGQFSEIARQLSIIAKASEETQETVIAQVKPVADNLKDHEKETIERCRACNAGIKEKITDSSKIITEKIESSARDQIRTLTEMNVSVGTIKSKVEMMEKDRIKARASYAMIVTMITAVATLIFTLVNFWMRK